MASRAGFYDGIRYRSERKLWGLPLMEVAMGPCAARGERWGKPRAIIAIGDFPIGVVAIGGISLGCFSIGGLAAGGFAMGGLAAGAITSGGLSIGLLLALGGLAIGGIAFGGFALGGIAIGGAAIGWAAIGGFAAGYYANGDGAVGAHVVSSTTVDPVAEAFFRKWFPWSLRNRNAQVPGPPQAQRRVPVDGEELVEPNLGRGSVDVVSDSSGTARRPVNRPRRGVELWSRDPA